MRQLILAAVVMAAISMDQAHAATGTGALAMSPLPGEEITATAGSPVFERARGTKYPAVRLNARTTGKIGLLPSIIFSAGELLAVDTDNKKLVACGDPSDIDSVCLIDRNSDGRFDAINTSGGFFPSKLPEPAAYTRGFTIIVPDRFNAYRQTLLFLGTSGQTLRMSYREFVDDLARPAFTEDVTFTLSGNYPETVAYKDLSIDILGVDNAGLRYVIRKAGN